MSLVTDRSRSSPLRFFYCCSFTPRGENGSPPASQNLFGEKHERKTFFRLSPFLLSLYAFLDGTRKIVKLTPEEGATNVPLSHDEISIEF